MCLYIIKCQPLDYCETVTRLGFKLDTKYCLPTCRKKVNNCFLNNRFSNGSFFMITFFWQHLMNTNVFCGLLMAPNSMLYMPFISQCTCIHNKLCPILQVLLMAPGIDYTLVNKVDETAQVLAIRCSKDSSLFDMWYPSATSLSLNHL